MMMQKTSKKSSKTSLESEKEHFSRTVLLFFDLAAILLSFLQQIIFDIVIFGRRSFQWMEEYRCCCYCSFIV